MPRISGKENKNIYFKKREELGLTREKAGELLECVAPERIEKIENERCEPHPEEVLVMADKYKAPEICNFYCSKQCPIGQNMVPEIKLQNLSDIVLNILASVNATKQKQEKLIEITADGQIDDEEIKDFIEIQMQLERIANTVSGLRLWADKMLANGSINKEKYNNLLKLTK